MLHKNVSITRRFHIKRGWETVPSPPNRTASLKTPTVPAGLQRVASTSRSQTKRAPHPNSRQAGRAVLTAERLQPGSSAGMDAGGRWWPLPLGPGRLRDSGWKHKDGDVLPALEEKTMPQTDRLQGGPGREGPRGQRGGAQGQGPGLLLDSPRVTVRHECLMPPSSITGKINRDSRTAHATPMSSYGAPWRC